MSTPVREKALQEIFDRLIEVLSIAYAVTFERARRAPVDVRNELLPRLVLTGGDLSADETQSPGETFYAIEFEVAGYLAPASDEALEADQAMFHAQIVAALSGWQSGVPGLGMVTELGADFAILPASESARRVVEVVCRFTIQAITPTGSPFL